MEPNHANNYLIMIVCLFLKVSQKKCVLAICHCFFLLQPFDFLPVNPNEWFKSILQARELQLYTLQIYDLNVWVFSSWNSNTVKQQHQRFSNLLSNIRCNWPNLERDCFNKPTSFKMTSKKTLKIWLATMLPVRYAVHSSMVLPETLTFIPIPLSLSTRLRSPPSRVMASIRVMATNPSSLRGEASSVAGLVLDCLESVVESRMEDGFQLRPRQFLWATSWGTAAVGQRISAAARTPWGAGLSTSALQLISLTLPNVPGLVP